jgi:hypothetical protein
VGWRMRPFVEVACRYLHIWQIAISWTLIGQVLNRAHWWTAKAMSGQLDILK